MFGDYDEVKKNIEVATTYKELEDVLLNTCEGKKYVGSDLSSYTYDKLNNETFETSLNMLINDLEKN